MRKLPEHRQSVIERLNKFEKMIQANHYDEQTLKRVIGLMSLYYSFILCGESDHHKLYDIDDCAQEIDEMIDSLAFTLKKSLPGI